jgi:hypothetical protein
MEDAESLQVEGGTVDLKSGPRIVAQGRIVTVHPFEAAEGESLTEALKRASTSDRAID